MRNSLTVLMIFVITMLSACATTVKNPALLSEFNSTAEQHRNKYLIQAGDVLEISFFGDMRAEQESETNSPTNLSGSYTVRPDGKIALQLLEAEVSVVGYTPDIVAKNLTTWYRRYMIEPIIIVNISEFAPRVVYVAGEVDEPQQIDHRYDLSVLDAIISVGYFTYEAAPTHVILIRNRGNGLRPMAITLDMEKVIINEDYTQNLALLPEDVVVVSMSGVAKVNAWIDRYIRRNIPIPMSMPLGGSN